jgi:hypothetical protein
MFFVNLISIFQKTLISKENEYQDFYFLFAYQPQSPKAGLISYSVFSPPSGGLVGKPIFLI